MKNLDIIDHLHEFFEFFELFNYDGCSCNFLSRAVICLSIGV